MATSTERTLVLPGDSIEPSLIPVHPKGHPIKLGPGLRAIPPRELVPTVAGQLVTDRRKNSIWVEYSGGRYMPNVGDLVIGTVQKGATDLYYVSLSDYTSNATLPHLAFEMATKKTRPHLDPGALVYARVTLANRHMDPELECVSQATGKADGLGPLTGGMLFNVSAGMARRMLLRKPVEDGKIVVLDDLGSAGLVFEVAIGRNGKIWVNSESIKTILTVGRAVTQTDEKALNIEQQKKLVKSLLKELS